MQVQRAFGLEHRLARVVHSPHPQGEDQGLAGDGGIAETTRGADEGLQADEGRPERERDTLDSPTQPRRADRELCQKH